MWPQAESEGYQCRHHRQSSMRYPGQASGRGMAVFQVALKPRHAALHQQMVSSSAAELAVEERRFLVVAWAALSLGMSCPSTSCVFEVAAWLRLLLLLPEESRRFQVVAWAVLSSAKFCPSTSFASVELMPLD